MRNTITTTPIPTFFLLWVTLYQSFDEICKRSMKFIATTLVSSSQLVQSIANYCVMFAKYKSFLGEYYRYFLPRYTRSEMEARDPRTKTRDPRLKFVSVNQPYTFVTLALRQLHWLPVDPLNSATTSPGAIPRHVFGCCKYTTTGVQWCEISHSK